MKRVHIVDGDVAVAAVIASMPERFTLSTAADADIVLVSPIGFVDDPRAVPALWYAPRLPDETITDAAIVELTIARTRLDELTSLVELLAVARVIGSPVESAELHHHSQRALAVSSGSVTMVVTSSPSGRDELHARVVSREARLDVTIDASAPARAARIEVERESGSSRPPLVHESSHRVTLRRIADGLEPRYTIGDLRADLAIARSLLTASG